MITKYGMDPELGLVVYPDEQNSDFSFFKPYSEETAIKIDQKVKSYLDSAYDVAKKTILKHKDTMEKIAEILIKKEYISGEDFSVMVENPDKIEEFKATEEIISNIEECKKMSSKKTSETKKEYEMKKKETKREEKSNQKKRTPRKKI